MSSHEGGGKCLACGKTSTLRCSSCANKGGIDLFFCSPAHQKLIWPYHRLVCGERAHPFRLPVYSQEEADVLLERLHEPANTPELRTLREKMRAAVEAHNANELDLKEKIQSLVGQEGSLAPDREPTPDPQSTAFLIRELRLLSWNWYAKAYTTGRDHVVQHFVEHMTAKYDQLTQDAPPVALDSVWHSRLCHHIAAPMSMQAEHLRFMRAASGGNRDFVPLKELARTPGGLKAVLEANAAFTAFVIYLKDTQDVEYAAFAKVVHVNNCKPDPELQAHLDGHAPSPCADECLVA